jgi:hypothetical protein
MRADCTRYDKRHFTVADMDHCVLILILQAGKDIVLIHPVSGDVL